MSYRKSGLLEKVFVYFLSIFASILPFMYTILLVHFRWSNQVLSIKSLIMLSPMITRVLGFSRELLKNFLILHYFITRVDMVEKMFN